MMHKALIIVSFILLTMTMAVAQQTTSRESIRQTITALNNSNDSLATENLYLQTDKSSYLTGDTVWFKAYLLNASFLKYSDKSGLLYIELTTDSNRLLKRIMLPVQGGITYGCLMLDEDLPRGSYMLRGYTSWMRNFEERYHFKKKLYVGNVTDEDWMVSYNTSLIKNIDKGQDKIRIGLKINQFDKAPIGLREMQVSVVNKTKTWFKTKTETSLDGLLAIDFDLPESTGAKTPALIIQDLRKSQNKPPLQIPLILNRPEDIDLQFMPEGGNLIAGQPTRIAFKAIKEDGLGVDINGKIYNSKSQEVAGFSTTHKGMGVFSFLPLSGEVYSAKIKLPDGSYLTYPLPVVENQGITLNIYNSFSADSCKILITPSPDAIIAGNKYYLIGQTRNVTYLMALVDFSSGPVKVTLDKSNFPTGIIRFILVDEQKKKLNERLIFHDNHDNLLISVESDKLQYKQRDSVLLNIKVTDKSGAPVSGSFSLAVTDDGQVKKDLIADGSIVSKMLLSSELKGNVEDPGYYFNGGMDAGKWNNLDNLLLTQGWVSYELTEAAKPMASFKYKAEQEFLVKGRIVNVFNKPVAGSAVALLSTNPFFVSDTLTNARGEFVFKGLFPEDKASYFISSKNKRGKSFNVGIEMEEFVPPVFNDGISRSMPWFVNIDTGTYLSLNTQVALQKEYRRVTGKNMLKTVEITARKVVKGSKNRNGPGGADLIIDEAELIKSPATTLGDLLAKRVTGLRVAVNRKGERAYQIHSMKLHLIIDGIDVDFFKMEGTSDYEDLKQYFDYYDAAEIKGIEVMYTGKYQMSYASYYLDPPGKIVPWDHAFVEVTTRGGRGPFVKKTTGTYLYKPMPFSLNNKFYSPKYSPGSIADMSDIRSTIHWEPNIITDQDGRATVKFYTADNTGSYTYVLEGSDINGHVGMVSGKMIISSPGGIYR